MAVRAAVIGLGDIARKAFLPSLTAREGLELFLYNRSPEKVDDYKELYRIRDGSSQIEDVFSWNPDAVFILTPTGTHYELMKTFLEAKIDVFSEKPATYESRQTEELAQLADQQERVLMIGFNRRYAPVHVQAKEAWDNRAVSTAFFEKHRSSPFHADLYHQLIDDTIHVIDTFRFFCGEARALQTVAQMQDGKVSAVLALLEIEDGGHAVISASLVAGRWLERYTLHGGQLSLEVDAFSGYNLIDEHKQQHWNETYASSWKTTLEGRGFKGEIDHFLDCIKTRQQPHTSAWDSVKTQRLVEDILAKS